MLSKENLKYKQGFADGGFPIMQNASFTPQKRKQTNLETADAMFKDAFIVKKARFSHLHPELSESDLLKMTAAYFKKLNKEPSSKGKAK